MLIHHQNEARVSGVDLSRRNLMCEKKRSVENNLAACVFAQFGYFTAILLEIRKMATADVYVNQCLPKLLRACCKQCSRTGVLGILLHADKTSTHIVSVTIDF